MTTCPHCMSEIHPEATTCPGCGAMRGVLAAGWTPDRYRVRAVPIFVFAALLALGVIVLRASGSPVGALLLSLPTALVLAFAILTRFILPSLPEKWYR